MINNLTNPTFAKHSVDQNRFDTGWTIWHIGAGIGLLGGMLILVCAAFLSLFQYFYHETQHGVWLYLIVLPLLFIGAHCLDKAEEIQKARRIGHCREHASVAGSTLIKQKK